jgi:predicted kinase
MQPKVILVNGFPASGKTTLATRLSSDLGVPLLGKDQLKEHLADTMQVAGDEWSAILGRASNAMLVELLRAAAGRQSLILESAFIAEFARPDIVAIIEKNDVSVLELYCVVGREERLRRWSERYATGARHRIHTDREGHNRVTDDELERKYAPLKIGEFLEVNTTNFDAAAYQTLLRQVTQFMERGDK